MTHDKQRRPMPDNRVPGATPTISDNARPGEEPPVDATREVALLAFERIKAARERAASRGDGTAPKATKPNLVPEEPCK